MRKLLDALNVLKTWKFWKEMIVMTLGMMVAAAAVYYFLVPSKLIIGSISGLSIVIANLFSLAGITIGLPTIVAVINAILLVLAYLLIDREFGLKTVYTAMILGPLIKVWDNIFPWENIAVANVTTGATSVMGDPWLDLCCFVLLLSASQALMFSINASTGGLDILAKIVNKYFHFDIGTSVSIAGAMICCTAFLINDFRMVVIGLIGTWINGLVVDYFSASLNNHKRICIVSKDWDRIRRFIIDDLHRGCTLYEVIGGYTNEKSIELQALLSKDEFSALMSYIKDNNISAFTTAGNVTEVYGLWFKNKHRKQIRHDAEKR